MTKCEAGAGPRARIWGIRDHVIEHSGTGKRQCTKNEETWVQVTAYYQLCHLEQFLGGFRLLICKINCKTGLHQFLSKIIFQGNISIIELSGGRRCFRLESLEKIGY